MTTEKKSINFHWEVLVASVFMAATILGVTIPLHTSIREDIRAINNTINAIHDEMKDFHGRLERQDAEFKAHLMYEHTKDK